MKQIAIFVAGILILVQLLGYITAEDIGSVVAENTTKIMKGE